MKVLLAVAVLIACSTTVLGLPASNPAAREDVELIPTSTFPDQAVLDTEFAWSRPFGRLFENIEAITAKMREQMAAIIKGIPSLYNNNRNDSNFDYGVWFPVHIDLSKANKTSVTKIIDGHKVVINDTEYSTSDANSSSVFVVRVIDVKPNDAETAPTDLKTSGEESSSNLLPPLVRDRESLENSLENEIPKSKEYRNHEEKRFANIETFDEGDTIEPVGNEIENSIEIANPKWDIIAQPTEKRYVHHPPPEYQYPQPSYLQSNYPVSSYPQPSYSLPSYPQIFFPQNEFTQANYPQMYQQAAYPQRYPPYDLSRDTYVNDILAQSGAPTNPDAEVFDNTNTSPVISNNRFRNPR